MRAPTGGRDDAISPDPGPAGVCAPRPARQTLIDALGEAVWLVDARDRTVCAVNDSALGLLARPRAAVLGVPAASLIDTPEDHAYWDELAAAPAGSAMPLHSTTVLVTGEGELRHVERRICAVVLDGRAYLLVSVLDHSARRRADAEREHLLADLRSTLESTTDGILVTDLCGRVRAFNRRLAELWALPEHLLGSVDVAPLFAWMLARTREPVDDARRLALLADSALARSCDRLLLAAGQVVERVAVPQCHGEQPIGRVYTFRDLSERVEAERQIERLSYTDTLTGLPNRRYLATRMAPALALAAREPYGVAVLFVDLDHFRQINESLGHGAGDRVLREVAVRLKACLRESDLIARVAGDQFVLLLHHADADGARQGARRVLDTVARPFTVDGATFTLTCSVGVAVFPHDAHDGDELVRHAETAMQQVKAGGRNHLRLHRRREAVPDLRARIALDHAMRQALASNRFRLHYQPQVRMRDGVVVGAEALIRWRDPERGEIPPGQFIPVAEDSGFIVALGDWVLDRAVQQAATWHRSGLVMPIAVNVSALQFQHDQFVERVAGALRAAGLPAHLLELELTESILLHDADEALARLRALAALGLRLAIDDFGTGYSSLAYLKQFPVHKLKIDRTFVRGLPDDRRDAGIVRALVQMARALELGVVAEGVETEAQRRFLADAGCDEFQGFLVAPALDSVHFLQHLRLGA